ncbi:MAG: DUF4271 domain-containing protein [Saprospiraceae bacterium]
MRQLSCCIIILFLFFGTSWAQNGENPFELQGRPLSPVVVDTLVPAAVTDLPSAAPPTETAVGNPLELQKPADETTTTEQITPNEENPTETNEASDIVKGNPFELQGEYTNPNSIQEDTVPTPTKKGSKSKATKSADNNFLFGIVAFMLILLTLLVTLYRSLLQKIYRAFLNDNFLAMIHREEGSIVSIPYLILYFMFFVNGGIFVFLLLRFYGQLDENLFKTLCQCIFGLMGVFFLKHLSLKVMANVFPVAKEIKQYSFMIIIFSIILGITLVPVNIMVAYLPAAASHWIIYLTFLVILLIYLFRALRGIFLSSKYITFYKFHFFMYLCTVEIAPVLILVKFGLILAGIQ